jgi:hypothetical protein
MHRGDYPGSYLDTVNSMTFCLLTTDYYNLALGLMLFTVYLHFRLRAYLGTTSAPCVRPLGAHS